MDVSFVHMDADDRLIAGQVLLRELPGDVQGQFRSQFVRTKGEDHVVVLDAVLLAIVPLGLQHLPHLPTRLTVHAGGKDLLLGLVPIKNITDAYIQAPLSGQNLGNRHLLFRHLVHQLINLVQQVQPAPGILRSGNPGVDATGDLVDVVANVMDLCAQGADLLRGTSLDQIPLNQPDQEGPLGQAAFAGLPAQQLVLLLCKFNVKVMRSLLLGHSVLLSVAKGHSSFRPQAALGSGICPCKRANVHLRYACTAAAKGGDGSGPVGA